MSENIIKVTDQNFEEQVIKSSKAVLVDFWAEWCGPCRMIAPILEDVAKEMADKLVIAKMNVDENEVIPTQMAIRGIPALLLFHNGTCIATKVGALSKSQLVSFLESHIH